MAMSASQKKVFLERMRKGRAAKSRSNVSKKKPTRKMVRILGQDVREGTKKHQILLQQQRQWADLQHSEQGDGRTRRTNKSKRPAGTKVLKRSNGNSDVRSPTRTSSDVRSPTKTSTSTWADTEGNVTVTGGAGAGATTSVKIFGKRKNAGRKKVAKRRRNSGASVDAAADRYKFFHGRDPGVIHDIETPIKTFGVLSGIGKLERLIINAVDGKHVVELEFGKGVFLAQDVKGRQLFIEGGDQSVRLEDFGITAKREHLSEVLGALVEVWYHTRKDHLHPEDGGTAIYQHKFGKGKYPKGSGPNAWGSRGDRLPLVMYDVTNKLLHITGGDYEIPAEGING